MWMPCKGWSGRGPAGTVDIREVYGPPGFGSSSIATERAPTSFSPFAIAGNLPQTTTSLTGVDKVSTVLLVKFVTADHHARSSARQDAYEEFVIGRSRSRHPRRMLNETLHQGASRKETRRNHRKGFQPWDVARVTSSE
jgi:hypothetical protein